MKRFLVLSAVLVAPLVLAACGSSYDSYRSEGHRYDDDASYDAARDTSEPGRPHSKSRPGAQVIYSSEVQGGYGPGSYGGRSSTVITPRENGVLIEGEYHGR